MSDELDSLLDRLASRNRETVFRPAVIPIFRSQAGVTDQEGTHSPTCRCSSAPVFPPPGSIWYQDDPNNPDNDGVWVQPDYPDPDIPTFDPIKVPTPGYEPPPPFDGGGGLENPPIIPPGGGASFPGSSGGAGGGGNAFQVYDPVTGQPIFGVGNDGSVKGGGLQSFGGGNAYVRLVDSPGSVVIGARGTNFDGQADEGIEPRIGNDFRAPNEMTETTMTVKEEGVFISVEKSEFSISYQPDGFTMGTASSSLKFNRSGATASGVSTSGGFSATGFNTASSRAVKFNIIDPEVSLLALVLKAKSYQWKYSEGDGADGRWRVGPMAEDIPEWLRPATDGLPKLSLNNQLGIAWGAMSELIQILREHLND